MSRFAEIFKASARVLLAVGLIAAGLVALFVLGWIVAVAMLGFYLYFAVRRMLSRPPPRRRQRASAGESAIIEGEFKLDDQARIEREDFPSDSRDRSGS
jgi:membrane protein implicated in regulation of membrane protease activity